ncbi:GNAT family N-acetyltransferase [Leptothrix discophora]|uniref:GNAT family N-acetyltransferase n=1 Tax=Leptothrix discophora TaxID=89 RepID=A0ABT9G8J9_LEPDI|nr:GNAT family N-acetyltransferase [Leptothrix discophora]MDP4302730.1 GNAT family N-acetyltransferase [Leptothrix discophora]
MHEHPQTRCAPTCAHPAVRLRPLVRDDLAAWFALLAQPAVHGPTSWNVGRAEDLIGHVLGNESDAADAPRRWAVLARDGGTLLGTVGLHSVSMADRRAEIGYELAPEARGAGIATAVCRGVTDWALGPAGLVRVQATVRVGNDRSQRVLERSGYQREGLLRSYRHVRGIPDDFWIWARIGP